MTAAVVGVDVEGAVRVWLRDHPEVTAAIGATKVWLAAVPDQASYPLVVVAPVGGDVDPYLPIDRALLQFDCWGANNRDVAGSGAAARAVCRAVWNLDPDTVLRADVVALGAEVNLRPVWSPDPDTGRARYIVSASFIVRAA